MKLLKRFFLLVVLGTAPPLVGIGLAEAYIKGGMAGGIAASAVLFAVVMTSFGWYVERREHREKITTAATGIFRAEKALGFPLRRRS